MLDLLFEEGGIKYLILLIPVILFSISIHEYAHGWLAYKLGDPTAQYEGRLTLNPLKHFNLFGFIMMLVAGFGWATPVPVNPSNFKNPSRGMLFTAIAGPISNFLVAFISSFFYILIYVLATIFEITSPVAIELLDNLLILLTNMMYLNIGLAVFNLIPIYPLDGSRVLSYFMPQKYSDFMNRYGQYVQIAFLLLIFLPEYIGLPDYIGMFVGFVQQGITDLFIELWALLFNPILGLF